METSVKDLERLACIVVLCQLRRATIPQILIFASYPLWLLTNYATLPSVVKVALCFPVFFPKLKLILKSTFRQVLQPIFENWQQHLTLKMRGESLRDLITFSIEQFIRCLKTKVSNLVFVWKCHWQKCSPSKLKLSLQVISLKDHYLGMIIKLQTLHYYGIVCVINSK